MILQKACNYSHWKQTKFSVWKSRSDSWWRERSSTGGKVVFVRSSSFLRCYRLHFLVKSSSYFVLVVLISLVRSSSLKTNNPTLSTLHLKHIYKYYVNPLNYLSIKVDQSSSFWWSCLNFLKSVNCWFRKNPLHSYRKPFIMK